MKNFNGNVLFLNKSNISLSEILGDGKSTALFENLKIAGFNPKLDVSGKKIIVSRENFAGDISDEDAEKLSAAFEGNSIFVLVSSGIARNLKNKMLERGMLAVEYSKKELEEMFRNFSDKDCEGKIVFDEGEKTSKVKLISGSLSKSFYFNIDPSEKSKLN